MSARALVATLPVALSSGLDDLARGYLQLGVRLYLEPLAHLSADVHPYLCVRPDGAGLCLLRGAGEGFTDDWAFCFAENEATPEMSYYLYCTELLSKLLFGANKGEQFTVDWAEG